MMAESFMNALNDDEYQGMYIRLFLLPAPEVCHALFDDCPNDTTYKTLFQQTHAQEQEQEQDQET